MSEAIKWKRDKYGDWLASVGGLQFEAQKPYCDDDPNWSRTAGWDIATDATQPVEDGEMLTLAYGESKSGAAAKRDCEAFYVAHREKLMALVAAWGEFVDEVTDKEA